MDEIVKINNKGELVIAQNFMDEYLVLKDADKMFKAKEKALKDALLNVMLEYGIKRVEAENYIITLTEASSSFQLDSKKVMKAFEEFGIEPRPYQKEVLRSAYVKIISKDEQVDYE